MKVKKLKSKYKVSYLDPIVDYDDRKKKIWTKLNNVRRDPKTKKQMEIIFEKYGSKKNNNKKRKKKKKKVKRISNGLLGVEID